MNKEANFNVLKFLFFALTEPGMEGDDEAGVQRLVADNILMNPHA